MNTLLVRDLMCSPVCTIPPHTRLPIIKTIMRQQRIHRLPIVESDRVIGIVTLGDIRNAYPSDLLPINTQQRMLLDRITAKQIMRTEVITIAPHAPLRSAIALLLHHKISGLPVLHENQLVGMLTKSDLCRALLGGDLVLAPLTREPAAAPHDILHNALEHDVASEAVR